MKIGVLCNGKIGIPAMQQLFQLGQQPVIFLPDKKVPEHEEIKGFAQYYGIPTVLVSKNRIAEQLITAKTTYALETFFVMTFPFILSDVFLKQVSVPVFNFHYAPLPEYRGAQPVFWMIKNGEKNGGVTVHLMTDKVDAGEVLIFSQLEIEENDTFGLYMAKAAQLACRTITELINILEKDNWKDSLKKQNEPKAAYWKTPQFSDILINWEHMKAMDIKRLCLAANPWNKGVFTSFNGVTLKIIDVEIAGEYKEEALAGSMKLLDENGTFGIVSKDHLLVIPKIIYTEEGFFYGRFDKLLGFYDGGCLK